MNMGFTMGQDMTPATSVPSIPQAAPPSEKVTEITERLLKGYKDFYETVLSIPIEEGGAEDAQAVALAWDEFMQRLEIARTEFQLSMMRRMSEAKVKARKNPDEPRKMGFLH